VFDASRLKGVHVENLLALRLDAAQFKVYAKFHQFNSKPTVILSSILLLINQVHSYVTNQQKNATNNTSKSTTCFCDFCVVYTVFQKKHPLILLAISWRIVVWF